MNLTQFNLRKMKKVLILSIVLFIFSPGCLLFNPFTLQPDQLNGIWIQEISESEVRSGLELDYVFYEFDQEIFRILKLLKNGQVELEEYNYTIESDSRLSLIDEYNQTKSLDIELSIDGNQLTSLNADVSNNPQNETFYKIPDNEIDALFQGLLEEQMERAVNFQAESWWDCFVRCLAKKKPNVEKCLKTCGRSCLTDPTGARCTACILACGAISWFNIISCAAECM